MPIALPFFHSLLASKRTKDRELWLRIAGDILNCDTNAATAIDPSLEAAILSRLERADPKTRLEVAKQLAKGPNLRRRVADAFIERDDAAGRWLLIHAERLPEETLVRALAEPRCARWLAERGDLSEQTIDDLVASQDFPTFVALAHNPGLALNAPHFGSLAAAAREAPDPTLAKALLARSPMRTECAALFLEASSQERREILVALQRAELGQVRRLKLRGADADRIARLEHAAIEGRREAFVDDITAGLGCSRELALRFVTDRSGELLATALAALRAPYEIIVRALTAIDLANGEGYRRLASLAQLQGLISPTAATLVVAALTDARADREATPTALPMRRAGSTSTREPVREPRALVLDENRTRETR